MAFNSMQSNVDGAPLCVAGAEEACFESATHVIAFGLRHNLGMILELSNS